LDGPKNGRTDSSSRQVEKPLPLRNEANCVAGLYVDVNDAPVSAPLVASAKGSAAINGIREGLKPLSQCLLPFQTLQQMIPLSLTGLVLNGNSLEMFGEFFDSLPLPEQSTGIQNH